MTDHQDLKRYIEAVRNQYSAWYEEIILSLILGETVSDKKPGGDNIKSLFGVLMEQDGEDKVKSIAVTKDALDKAVNNILALSEVSDAEQKREIIRVFIDSYGRFQLQLRSCLATEEDGDFSKLDKESGLKLEKTFDEDYNIEMERLDRDGHNFTLCLLRCDPIWHKDTENKNDIFIETSKVILSNLRLFDDAYRYKDDYILVFLKHTRSAGGVIFYERTQRQFDVSESVAGCKLSTSACIVAPIKGQNAEQVLTDMKKDLDETCKDVRDDYITITETTDLQRFLGSKK